MLEVFDAIDAGKKGAAWWHLRFREGLRLCTVHGLDFTVKFPVLTPLSLVPPQSLDAVTMFRVSGLGLRGLGFGGLRV